MFFMAALSIASSIFGFLGQRSAAQAQTIIAKANADAENLVRKSRNEFEGASAALSNYIRSEKNNQILKAAGGQYNAISQNIVRMTDQATKGTIESRLRASENMGALVAQVGALGIGGASVEQTRNTMRLQQQRGLQEAQLQSDYATKDAFGQKEQIMSQAVGQMDMGQTFANIDRSISIAPYIAKPSAFMAIAEGFMAAGKYLNLGAGQTQAKTQGPVTAPVSTTSHSIWKPRSFGANQAI